ncbi:hypothetical protein QZH41_003866 [Actinostola sp. cb2023]|nr:hypothetical protein QZH41_003866 [Actinostola sp. cb2023]
MTPANVYRILNHCKMSSLEKIPGGGFSSDLRRSKWFGVSGSTIRFKTVETVVLQRSFEEHLHRLRLVFSRIRQAGLKLKPAKCQFLKQRVTFLGHVVSSQGIETDPEKTKAVVDWPVPVDVKELQRFLGLVGYYRRFVT